MWIGIIAVVLATGAGCLCLWVFRTRARPKAPRYVFRCPTCAQQIRFIASQAGAGGHCPRCWKPITLPLTPEVAAVDAPPGRFRPRKFWDPAQGVGGRLEIQAKSGKRRRKVS